MDNSKFAVSAAVTDRLLKILQIFMIALAAVSAVFILLTFIMGKKAVADAAVLTLGTVDIKFTGASSAYLDEWLLKISVMASQLMKILTFGMIWLSLRILRRILKPVREGHAVTEQIGSDIRKLALTVLIGGALTEGRQKLEAVLGLLTYKLDVLLRDPSASTVSVNDALDLWFVIAALMLFFLSFVVQYAVRQHAPVSELPAER